jgi:ABC-2 type transport system ATP-binding protein
MSVQLTNITKVYAHQKALDDVSFSIRKGEIVGLLGPNGAGKSTLMKIVTGYISASSGSAKVNGQVVAVDKADFKKDIGYLPEHNPLYLDLYVKEYLAFNASVYKVPKSRIQQVIERTGLGEQAGKQIGQLSKGYRQRVGLAAALLHEPEVLILDEPTTGLDPNQLAEIRGLIKEVGKEKTVILSTHIMQEVEALCDRVIIINNGQIVLDSPIDRLRNSKQQVLEVEFDYRVEEVALQQLPSLSEVENTRDFRYRLVFDTQRDMRSTVFDFAHDNGLKILSLEEKSENLEKLFSRLTTRK